MGDLTFTTRGTEDIYCGRNTKHARQTLPRQLWRIAAKELDLLRDADELNDLKVPPNNKLHALTGDRKGQHAISINDQYRVCFTWTEKGAKNAEICDYH